LRELNKYVYIPYVVVRQSNYLHIRYINKSQNTY